MKKRKLLIWLAILAAAIMVFLLVIKPFSGRGPAYAFETVTVESGNIVSSVTATGTVEAVTTVEVGTQVSGIINKVYVDFNDEVRQGQLLARIDEVPLRAQLEQSQASVDQAQAEFDYQESNYNRLKALYEKQLISKSDYDQAVYNYNRSRASLANAKSAYDRSKVNLDYATITSPINGVVLNRVVEEGQTVAASFNTPTLFTIVNDLTQMEVQTSVDEADIGRVNEGQRVHFTVDAYPDETFQGRVSQVRLQPVVTNNVVTYTVILDAPNPEKKLMPGMTASATIYVDEKSNVLLIPGKALRFTPDMEVLQQIYGNMGMPGMMPEQGSLAEGGVQMPQASLAGQGFTPPAGGFPPPPEGSDPSSMGFPPEAMAAMAGSSGSGPVTVWTLKNDSIRPVIIVTGIDNGSDVEVVTGLKAGDQVILKITSGGEVAEGSGSGTGDSSRGGFGPPSPF